MQIINYILQEKIISRYEPFPKVFIYRKRLKFLTGPLNWLLQKLDAQQKVECRTQQRIKIDYRVLREQIQKQVHNLRLYGNQPKILVIGVKQFSELMKDEVLNTYSIQTIDSENYLGYRLKISPFIDGFVIID